MPPYKTEQARIRGTALDQTFASDHPYRDGQVLTLNVPQSVQFRGGGWGLNNVSPSDRDVVEKAYHAVHLHLAGLRYMVLMTDKRLHDDHGAFVGTALLVRDKVGGDTVDVGSFDAIVSDRVSEPNRLGAVDVKYTEVHHNLQSATASLAISAISLGTNTLP